MRSRIRIGILTGKLLAPAALWAVTAHVDHLSGHAESRAAESAVWESVYPGDKIEQGASVRTGEGSELELTTGRGHKLKVKGESVVDLAAIQDDDTQIRLEKGRVFSKVQHLKKAEKFAVQTPTAVCAVRGTEFETASGDKGTSVAVFRGIVGVSAGGPETLVHAGQMTNVHDGTIEMPRTLPKENQTADSAMARTARHEVGLDMSRNAVLAAAALEQRLAEYQEGKSLIDVNGRRVRVDEYILRPAPDQFKFVALNQRDERLDYFFYKGTFNQTLPTDLSVALKDLSGRVGGTAPDYYLTAYEMGQSNTQDSVHDTATGGHLVKISVDSSGDFVLTDPTNPSNTRTVTGAELQTDGTYKVYNPLADSFSTVSAADLAANTKFGVYIPENDSFRDLAPGDTLWKTRFDTYTHALNNVTKIAYTPSGATPILASTLDGTWTYAGGFVLPVVTVDANNIDATVTNYYGDGTFERYRTVLIDDEGHIAPKTAFDGVSTGADYKSELLKWNYEQQVEATEFNGRKIDLVVEPKIFIKSGLIQ